MKIIILAAGKGSRLTQGNSPKPLTLLATGKSILWHQLEVFKHYFSLDDVIVVVGYRKEEIMNDFPDLLYVYNPDYALENTSKSLLRALKKCQEDLLWINGDVVFHPSVMEALLKEKRTGMIVNLGAVEEEEVKYRHNESGKILEVSKEVLEADGEALGINYWSKADLKSLQKNLEACSSKDYFERGIELCIEQGMFVKSIPIDPSLCTEVDFPEDLERANALLSTWKLQL